MILGWMMMKKEVMISRMQKMMVARVMVGQQRMTLSFPQTLISSAVQRLMKARALMTDILWHQCEEFPPHSTGVTTPALLWIMFWLGMWSLLVVFCTTRWGWWTSLPISSISFPPSPGPEQCSYVWLTPPPYLTTPSLTGRMQDPSRVSQLLALCSTLMSWFQVLTLASTTPLEAPE